MTSTKAETAHKTAGLVYCLWLLGILFGITAIIGVIINHTHLDKTRGTHVHSHFIWQITSFWTVLAGIVFSILFWQSVGQIIAIATFFIWLFSGLIGSWYLSKSRRIRLIDREHTRGRHPHHVRREIFEENYENS